MKRLHQDSKETHRRRSSRCIENTKCTFKQASTYKKIRAFNSLNPQNFEDYVYRYQCFQNLFEEEKDSQLSSTHGKKEVKDSGDVYFQEEPHRDFSSKCREKSKMLEKRTQEETIKPDLYDSSEDSTDEKSENNSFYWINKSDEEDESIGQANVQFLT